MNTMIIAVENFKFSIFDSVPKPNQDIAFILYKEGNSTGDILVITEKHPALSNQIRAGRFDRKMTITLADREVSINKETVDTSGNFKFIINVKILYKIRDIEYIFRNHLWNTDSIVENTVMELIEKTHKKYDIESQIELQNELRINLQNQVEEWNYLDIFNLKISVEADERAKKIIDSNLDTMAETVLIQNESDRASVEVEQRKRLEIQKLEAEKEIEEKKSAVRLEKAKGVNALKDVLGDEFGTFLAYANGEITSIEFDDRMQKNKNANMMANIAWLKQLVDLDVFSGPQLERAALKLLGEETAGSEMEQKAITISADENSDIIVEDTEEY